MPLTVSFRRAAVPLVLLFMTGCGTSAVDGPSTDTVQDAPERPTVAVGGEAFTPFGARSLDDVVSLARQVSLFRVDSDQIGELNEVIPGVGEGSIGRQVSVTVLRNLWVAPGAEPVRTTTFNTYGFVVRRSDPSPNPVQRADPRLQVGSLYVAPLLQAIGVTFPSPGTLWQVRDGMLVSTPSQSDLVRRLDGLSLTELSDRLAAAEPLPGAVPFLEEPVAGRRLRLIQGAATGQSPAPTTIPTKTPPGSRQPQ